MLYHTRVDNIMVSNQSVFVFKLHGNFQTYFLDLKTLQVNKKNLNEQTFNVKKYVMQFEHMLRHQQVRDDDYSN